MKSYRIAHITDLLQIPPEHWDECMQDIRGCIVSLHLLRAAAASAENAPELVAPSDMCPFIEFTPDGKGEITPMCGDMPLMTPLVTRGDQANAKDQRAGDADARETQKPRDAGSAASPCWTAAETKE